MPLRLSADRFELHSILVLGPHVCRRPLQIDLLGKGKRLNAVTFGLGAQLLEFAVHFGAKLALRLGMPRLQLQCSCFEARLQFGLAPLKAQSLLAKLILRALQLRL